MKRTILIILLTCCLPLFTNAQGCSDAGVCTAGSFHQSSSSLDTLDLEAGMILGLGDGGTLIMDLQILAAFHFNENWTIQTKVPYRMIFGDLGNVQGLADPTIVLTYSPIIKEKSRLALNLGVKFKANDGDQLDEEGQPLPMVYQTSLGTTDLLAGVTFSFKQTKAGMALQVPFGTNENGFVSDPLSFSDAPFPTTQRLTRQPDLVLRVDQSFQSKNEKWAFTLGALPIFHLGEDTYEDASGNEVSIDGSSGLTLNITFAATRKFYNGRSLSLRGGFPAVVRETRPDGLTRNWVVGLFYDMGF